MDHSTTYQLIADYVLDLLPAEKRHLVENHVAACPACRQAIQRERQVGQVVRETLIQLPRPSAARLSQLRPVAARSRPFFLTAQRSLAALTLMVLVVLGTLGLNRSHQATSWPVQSPTGLVMTETATATTPALPGPTGTQIVEKLPQTNRVATAGPAAVPDSMATPDVTLVVYSN